MKVRPLIARSGGLAVAAVAALALGIGLTSLMFAIVDGTVRRGLPAPAPGDIIHLERLAGPGDEAPPVFLVSELDALRQQQSLAALAAYRPAEASLTGDALTPRRWAASLVTPNTFEILGAAAAIGDALSAGRTHADGATPIVISDTVWREQFGADPSIPGRAVRANGTPGVIVGVMPAGFRFPVDHHVWMPLDERVRAAGVNVWGRLAPGVTGSEAAGELTARYAQARAGEGEAAAATRVATAPFTEMILGAPIVALLDSMFLAGLAVLAIACANAANLLLARGLARRREFAIATALGASRARMVRDRVAEALLLAAPAAVIGVALAYAGASAFNRAIAGSTPPYWVDIAIDARVLVYVVAVTVLTALAAATLPALGAGMAPPSTALAEETRSTTSGALRRTTAALVVVEIALAAAVLVCAGLMGKGLMRLTSAEFAFAVNDVVTGRVSLPARAYGTDEQRREFYLTMHTRLDQLRASQAAALGSSLPFAFADLTPFSLGGGGGPDPSRWPSARLVLVSPGYFEALGVRTIGGRDFEESDREGRAPVAIVNLSFALTHARRDDLIGRTLRAGDAESAAATIVGVVPDLFVGNVRGEQPETIYLPLFQQQALPPSISVLARAAAPAASVERELRAAIAEIDPELPLDRVRTLEGVREQGTWFYRVFGLLFLAFGAGALVLALVGVYAVMSFAVTRRTREIGTRMALGATGGDIARMFLREGTVRLVVGLAAGAVLAASFAPRLALFLFQVQPHDTGVFAAACAIVGVVGVAACAVPALRAARHNPVESLRDE